MHLSILQLSCRLFLEKHHITKICQPPYSSLRLLVFPKAKTGIESEEMCECDGHTVHKLSQRGLTADWLAPWESDCSQMRSKVSSDWLPSYIRATRSVLKIFKMAGYFPDSPRIWHDMIYLSTAIGLTPGGSGIAYIYMQTIHRTTQITNLEECGPCPIFASFTPALALQLRK